MGIAEMRGELAREPVRSENPNPCWFPWRLFKGCIQGGLLAHRSRRSWFILINHLDRHSGFTGPAVRSALAGVIRCKRTQGQRSFLILAPFGNRNRRAAACR